MKFPSNTILNKLFYKNLKSIRVIIIRTATVKAYFYVKYHIYKHWLKIVSREINNW